MFKSIAANRIEVDRIVKVTRAKEVLRRYAARERDFHGLNFEGESFRGANLSGANFSGANFSNTKLHSTKFNNAILTDAKFIDAKCGIQDYLQVFLTIIFIWLLGVTGLGAFTSPILVSSALVLLIPNPGFNNEIVIYIAPAIHILFFIFFVFFRIKDNVGIIGEAIKIAIISTIASLFAVATAVSTVTAIALLGEISKFSGFIVVIIGSIIIVLVDLYVCYFSLRKFKENDWLRSLTIAFAAIGGTSFKGANLTDANFSFATLKSTDFRGANLTRVRWDGAKMLDRVRPGDTYLKNTQVRQWLIGEGKNKNFDRQDLRGINLEGEQNLTDASFIKADLSEANLKGADLSRAKLVQTQLDKTNLTGATLTGAYIEDWGITIHTKLERVKCEYVFMRLPTKENPVCRRKPDNEHDKFEGDDFADFIKPFFDTLDLYHNQGVDPRAIAISLKELSENNPDANLRFASMGLKGENNLLLRLKTEHDADLSELNAEYFSNYNQYKGLSENELRILLIEKSTRVEEQIKAIKRFENLLIIILMYGKSNIFMGENINMSDGNIYNTENAGVVHNEGEIKDNAKVAGIYNEAKSQNLAEAAAEIQKLLEQLSQTYPTNTSKEKNIVVGEAVERIENKPRLKMKVINALKHGGIEAFKEAVNHPLINILMATIEGWQDVEVNNPAKEEILNDFRQAWQEAQNGETIPIEQLWDD